jgi:hypothetical protein
MNALRALDRRVRYRRVRSSDPVAAVGNVDETRPLQRDQFETLYRHITDEPETDSAVG